MTQYEAVFTYINKIFTYYIERTDISKTSPIDYLLQKSATDIDCIATLVKMQNATGTDYVQQIMVITRSFIESAILFVFLLTKEEYRIQYQLDSQLLFFKNVFMDYKYALTSPGTWLQQANLTLEMLQQGLIDTFNNLEEINRAKILGEINTDEFVLTETTISGLDHFFKKYKPVSFRVREMWKELESTIKIEGKSIEELTKLDYNTTSQFTHNIYPLKTPCIFDAARICFRLTTIICTTIKKEYKQDLPEDMCRLINQICFILYPEDFSIPQ